MIIKRKWLISASVVFVLGLFSFTTIGVSEKYFEIAKNMKIFAQLYQEVNTFYVDDVNPTQLMNTGIEAMLSTLDPYTNYIPEDRIEDYRTMTTGEYGGLGVVVGNRNGDVTVLMPNEGFAAFKAGLQIGDVIEKVDGIEIKGKNSEEISKLLKGQAGTELTLTLKRFGYDAPIDVSLKREKIHLKNVPYYGMVTNNIGLIQLTDFTQKASREVKEALLELKAEGAEKIILDLRGNPGGLLSEAIDISNIFIPKNSEVVTTKGRIEEWNQTYKATNSPVDTDIPLAVLINDHSASAAEIVSGVMQDLDRGILIGNRSFGKGLVQATRKLNYNSRLKVTVAKYYIPSGRCIQAIDYSHRDENGRASKVPDSLRIAFETNNGRTVYDGGGVAPDIEVDAFNYAKITHSLVSKGLIFDYATQYRFEHPEIVEAKKFNLTDQEYQDFITWLKDKDYNYDTKVEFTLDKLEEAAKEDKYYTDIKEEINKLRQKVDHNKGSDLIKFQKEVKEILEAEIATRYYFEAGQIEASFDDDVDIQAAVKALNDDEKYQNILSGENQ